jgi:hypothetical protein
MREEKNPLGASSEGTIKKTSTKARVHKASVMLLNWSGGYCVHAFMNINVSRGRKARVL